MLNPFIISSTYVGPDYFCDRKEETREIISNIANGRNTVLISSRRMGKSGLIENVFFQPQVRKNYLTFNVDIMNTCSEKEFVFVLTKNVLDKVQPLGRKFLEAFVASMKSISASFSIKFPFGDICFSYTPETIKKPETTLEELFRYLDSTEKTSILAIDEFQQIAEYPNGKQLLAYIRSLVQKSKRTRFIFSGSSRRMMEKLFSEPSEPFFQSCSPVYLDAIDKKAYFLFAKKHFNDAGKDITEPCFNNIYDKFSGHTWYIQYVLNRIFETTDEGNVAETSNIGPAIDHILKLNDRNFAGHFSRLSEKKRNLLIAVALNVSGDSVCGSVKEITSSDFVQKNNLGSASSVQSALRPLCESEMIVREGEFYLISNKFFSAWLLKCFS